MIRAPAILLLALAGCAAPGPSPSRYEGTAGTKTTYTTNAAPGQIQPPPAPAAVPVECYGINRHRQIVRMECPYPVRFNNRVWRVHNPRPLDFTLKRTIEASVDLRTWYRATNVTFIIGNTNTDFSFVTVTTNKPREFYRVPGCVVSL